MSRQGSPGAPTPARPIGPVLAAARAEADLARHAYVGVEHLLVALTRFDAEPTAHLLAEHGISYEPARAAVWRVVGSGRGDGPRFDPATLLATLGIELDQVRAQIERQFGPDAVDRLYAGPVGWKLRPRGPLCDLGLSPNLKRAVANAIGRCWDAAPPQLHERLLLGSLDVHSPGLAHVLDELSVSITGLRAATDSAFRMAS